jgi:pre-rRNA-processing protein IPI1
MAKSKKAQKKVDFNKVRFKIGKKLPKNLNETRTNFKAKSLIIKQQFSNNNRKTNEPVSHRNLTLKELFTNLNHHNVNTRLDAITSIRDMCQENKHLVLKELGPLLEHVCLLFNDRDHKIRKVAIQLLGFVLHSDLDKVLFRPYYNLLNAHLSCSMTHIDENIQNSSLQILDLLIQYLPNLILSHYSQIFEAFIEQISKLSTIKSSSKTKRVLKNDPYKLTSTQAWRSNVLSRIYKLISLLTNEYHPQTSQNTNKREEHIQINDTYQAKIIIYNDNHQNESFKLQITQNTKQFSNDIHLFFKNFVHILGPLLIDCWIEAKPEDSSEPYYT